MFALASCDRVKKLHEERVRVEQEAERVQADTQAMEQRILAMGSLGASATLTLGQQTAAFEQKVSYLKGEIATISAKLKALEEASSKHGPKVDSYKAKYLR